MTSASKSGVGMASTSRKRTAVLRDEEVEYLLQSESEQSLSDSDGDTEDELEDRALIDTVITEGSDEDDSAKQDFIWGVWKTMKDEGKISQAVLDLKVLQGRNCGHFLIVF
jgi:hypothetical protein